jgi:hypothetical protein
MRAGVLWCALGWLSGCFYTGYELDQLPLQADTGVGATDAGALTDAHAVVTDGSQVDAVTPPRDASQDADGRGPAASDAALADAERGASDAEVARQDAEASIDAALDADASDSQSDAQLDASNGQQPDAAADAGADACGTYGCVSVQSCTGSACDLTCKETPDPDNTATLDCQYDCTNSPLCTTSCSRQNTCLTNCSSVGTCKSNCTELSYCTTNCTNVGDCGGDCPAGSNCDFQCTASTCTSISCALGAACRVKCNGTGTCNFSFCGNSISLSCPDGSIVCGRGC